MLSSTSDFIGFVLIIAFFIVAMITFFFLLLVKNTRIRQKAEVEIRDAIINTQEVEQNRIADDLHDEIGPMLSAIKLKVSSLCEVEKDEMEETLTKIEEYLDQAIGDVRAVSHNLSSKLVGRYGLSQSLSENASLIKKTRNINVTTDVSLDEKLLTDEIKINLYRIIRELLNNSVKHSNCSQIHLSLKSDQNNIQVKYSDNGKSDVSAKTVEGLGQSSVMNRLRLLHAEIKHFSSEFSNGSDYQFSIPLIK